MQYRYAGVVYSGLESLVNALVALGHTSPFYICYKPTDTIADAIVLPVVVSATDQVEQLAQRLHAPVWAWLQAQHLGHRSKGRRGALVLDTRMR